MEPYEEIIADAVGDVTRLTDALLARARAQNPGVEFSISLDQAQSLLLPRTSDRVYRTVNGQLGYYAGHVYDDALVEASDHLPEYAALVTLVPVDSDAPLWQGDLRTGLITSLP